MSVLSSLARGTATVTTVFALGCADQPGSSHAAIPTPTSAAQETVDVDDTPSTGEPPPLDPCGTDLDVHLGTAPREVGDMPAPVDWSGDDPARAGPITIQEMPTSVPIVRGTLRAAGQEISVTAGTLRATFYAPTTGSELPLVIVLPGFTMSFAAYATYARHLASYGFAVAGIDTRAELLRAVHDQEAHELTQAITWITAGESPLGRRVDPTKIALAGHSKGGKLAFYTAALDARVDLVIGWDPSNGGGGPCAFDANCNRLPVAPNCAVNSAGLQAFSQAETLVIGAPPDPLFNPDENLNAKHFYRGAKSPASYVLLKASHAAWSPTTADADVVRITKSVTLALLLQSLRDVTGLEPYLPGGAKLSAEPLVVDVRRK